MTHSAESNKSALTLSVGYSNRLAKDSQKKSGKINQSVHLANDF